MVAIWPTTAIQRNWINCFMLSSPVESFSEVTPLSAARARFAVAMSAFRVTAFSISSGLGRDVCRRLSPPVRPDSHPKPGRGHEGHPVPRDGQKQGGG